MTKKDVEKIIVIPQFELTEDVIDEMVEDAKKELIGKLVSDIGLTDSESLVLDGENLEEFIGATFGFGVFIGICNTLEALNSAATLSEELSDVVLSDEVLILDKVSDNTSGHVS